MNTPSNCTPAAAIAPGSACRFQDEVAIYVQPLPLRVAAGQPHPVHSVRSRYRVWLADTQVCALSFGGEALLAPASPEDAAQRQREGFQLAGVIPLRHDEETSAVTCVQVVHDTIGTLLSSQGAGGILPLAPTPFLDVCFTAACQVLGALAAGPALAMPFDTGGERLASMLSYAHRRREVLDSPAELDWLKTRLHLAGAPALAALAGHIGMEQALTIRTPPAEATPSPRPPRPSL